MTKNLKVNLIDKAICSLAPDYGLRRLKAKATLGFLRGGYNGASHTRKALKNWNPISGDSDRDDIPDLETLRNRSYDSDRNVSLARAIIETYSTNTVGTGLKVQPQIPYEMIGLTEEEAEKWQSSTMQEFKLYAESKDCDATRMSDFYELQYIAFVSAMVGGDCLALLPFIERKNSPYSLSIKLLEGQHLYSKDDLKKDNIIAGIETDENGAVKNYHILKKHPGGVHIKRDDTAVIVPAFGKESDRRNVIHLFYKRRPGQKRGIPLLAPVIEDLKQIGRYTEAELMAAVISGMFTVFIKSDLGEVGDGLPAEENDTEYEDDRDYSLGNGAIVGLAPGESIDSANPTRPNPNFEPFFNAMVKQIGASLQIPYEVLMKHFTASYSASRGALLEAWKFFKQKRRWLSSNFCQPIYEEWLTEAVMIGRIKAPGFLENPMIKKAYCQAVWNGDAPGQLDPVKETKAAKMRCEEGFSTRTKESAEINGSDFDKNISRGKKEREKMLEAKFIKEENETDND